MRGANAQSAVKKFGGKRRNAPQTAQNLPSDNLHQEKPKARLRAISEKITQILKSYVNRKNNHAAEENGSIKMQRQIG